MQRCFGIRRRRRRCVKCRRWFRRSLICVTCRCCSSCCTCNKGCDCNKKCRD